MTDRDMGGPAFPTKNGRQVGPHDWRYEGMTLWDYYAAAALSGLMAEKHGSVDLKSYVGVAASIADLILAERAKRIGGGDE